MEQVTKIIFIRFLELLFTFDNTNIYNNIFLNDYHRTIDFFLVSFRNQKRIGRKILINGRKIYVYIYVIRRNIISGRSFHGEDLFLRFQSPTPPQYVFWYHNNRMINYDTTRGSSVTVQTDSSSTQSRLTIHQAVESDTGNYTCSASNTKPASIYVFVTEGKNNSFNNSSSDSIFSLMKKKTNKQTNKHTSFRCKTLLPEITRQIDFSFSFLSLSLSLPLTLLFFSIKFHWCEIESH